MCGGGGGSGAPYYENQDKLFGVQADIATNMYNQYAAYAPGYLANSASMVNEANSGALAARMRGQAAADSASAAAMEREATTRQLQSMGVNPNDARFAGSARGVELGNAAQRASAMNNASWQAEDQKWNRNANAYGQISGMGSGAMQGLGSAASGYGQMANSVQANNNAAMSGYGQFGAAVGYGMFKADGGYVDDSELEEYEPHYAIGGAVNPVPMPQLGDWRSRQTAGKVGGGSMGSAAASFAAPIAAQGIGKLATAGAKAGYKALVDSPAFTQPAAPVVEMSSGLGRDGANTLSDFVGSNMAEKAGEEAGSEAAKNLATNAAAESAPGIGQAIGFGTNLAQGDYIGAGLNLIPGGNYLDMGKDALQFAFGFADGGPVEGGLRINRQNFQPGGAVQGPGGPTEDAIPAWLSNGEHVQNETSTQLAGVDVLDAINQIGLQVRQGQLSPDAAVQAIGEIMKARGAELAGPDQEAAPEPAQRGGLRKPKTKSEKKFKSTKPAKMELKEKAR